MITPSLSRLCGQAESDIWIQEPLDDERPQRKDVYHACCNNPTEMLDVTRTESFMHGNFIFSCMEFSYFHAWKSHIFMHGNLIFSCMEMIFFMKIKISLLKLLMHETFCTGTYPATGICFGTCVQN